MKRMLINATHPEEIRVALADGQKLYNLDIDTPGQDRKKGNIYKGKITRVEPSLEAAFVDYGSNRHGFLPYKEISRNYYTDAANKMKERPPISVAVKEGTEVIIQVNKEERGNKGAAITTYISLAGRYLVYMPENPKAGGISRRIEGKARQDLKDTLSKVTQPKNSGVIVRTAGIGRSSEELDWDLNYLDQVWTAIKANAANRKAPFFIYQESDIFIRAIRDYLRPDVGEILIDNKKVYEKVRDFMQQVMPHNLKKLSYYNDNIPLFSRYQIEGQIQSAFSREVRLPSGGSIVIDHTEAMISIDINSARATKGSDIEETATNTNLEAADEIARQLRIRDLGGLVVIDFIDMRNHKNQKSVEQQLDEAVSNDRARIQTSKISRFGLLEMSRQRLRSSINEASQFVCPRCSGHGFIRNIESLSVSILRIMEEEALKPETGKVIAQVPIKVANFIMNEKRSELNNLEARHSVPMLMIANEFYQTPQFEVTRLKKSESDNIDINNITLNKPESEEQAENKSSQVSHQKRQVAAVDVLKPTAKVPERIETKSGLTGWIKSLFSSNNTTTKNKPEEKNTQHKQSSKQVSNPEKPQKHNQNKKPQNNQTKHQNKPQQGKKTQNNKQTAKNKAPQQKKPQQNKQPVKNNPQKPSNKPQGNKKPSQKPSPQQKKTTNKQVETVKVKAVKNETDNNATENSEQILQRPLGSVASYAANKAKPSDAAENIASNTGKKTNTKPKKVTEDTSKQDNKSIEKKSGSTQNEKPQTKNTNKTDNQDNKVTESKNQDKTKTANDSKQKIEPKTEKISTPKDSEVKTTTKATMAKVSKKPISTKKKATPDVKVDAKIEQPDTVEKTTVKKPTTVKSQPDQLNKDKTEEKLTKQTKTEGKATVKKTTPKAVEPKNKPEEKPSIDDKKPMKPVGSSVTKGSSKPKDKPKTKAKVAAKKPSGTKTTPVKPSTEAKTPAKPKKKMPDSTSGIDFDI